MKLDDFLRVKQARCVVGYDGHLTAGKTYPVLGLSVPNNLVKVENDNGFITEYDFGRFEPVLGAAENPLQKMELTPELEAVVPHVSEFKAGDPVYWGLKSKIFKIHRFMSTNVLEVELDGGVTSVHKDELCPATLENYGKLCSLFECIDFEQPHKELTGDELVRAMLTKGIKNVLCLWGNGDKIIIDRLDYKGSLMSADCRVVGGLTPIDWYTGEPLTQAVLDE